MTKAQMIERIIGIYETASGKVLKKDLRDRIISAGENANSKETIQRYYWKTSDKERLHYVDSAVQAEAEYSIWALTQIKLPNSKLVSWD